MHNDMDSQNLSSGLPDMKASASNESLEYWSLQGPDGQGAQLLTDGEGHPLLKNVHHIPQHEHSHGVQDHARVQDGASSDHHPLRALKHQMEKHTDREHEGHQKASPGHNAESH